MRDKDGKLVAHKLYFDPYMDLFSNEIVNFHIGKTLSDEVLHEASERWENLSEYVMQGNCLDNSVMGNFFGLLKQEIYYGHVYHSYEELKTALEEYIVYYNER